MTMTRPLLLIVLLFGSVSVQAEVYRWKDAQGNVVFSDTPHDGAQIIELGPTTVVPGEPPPNDARQPAAAETAPAFTSYRSIAVVAPSDDETLRDQQAIGVDVLVEPGLQLDLGHRVVLYLDGALYGEPSDSANFSLPAVQRGSHQLAAAVIDASGAELIRSIATVFHLHKTSAADSHTGKSRAPSLPTPPKAK